MQARLFQRRDLKTSPQFNGESKQTNMLFPSKTRTITDKLPFTLEEFIRVYNNPIVQNILFERKVKRGFLYPELKPDSPIEEIAKVVAAHIHKAALSWELVQHQQRKMIADRLGNIAHTVSDRKLSRILSAILEKPESKHEPLLFGRSPYLSACMTGEGQTYFRVDPSTLQAKLILEFNPHQIFWLFSGFMR